MPPTMAPDLSELLRVDADGTMAYSRQSVLEADVVVANMECSYWTSKAVAGGYPNPLYVRLTRAMWASHPGEARAVFAPSLLVLMEVPLSLVSVCLLPLANRCGRFAAYLHRV